MKLAHQGVPFEIHAKVSLQDAYPDKPCLFDLTLFEVRSEKGTKSTSADGARKGVEKVTEFSDGSPV